MVPVIITYLAEQDKGIPLFFQDQNEAVASILNNRCKHVCD